MRTIYENGILTIVKEPLIEGTHPQPTRPDRPYEFFGNYRLRPVSRAAQDVAMGKPKRGIKF